MNTLIKKTFGLEEYECLACGRSFYIREGDKTVYDLDFGCPFGCDDAGKFARTVVAKAKTRKRGEK